MTITKQELGGRTWIPGIANNALRQGTGIVIEVKEIENTCSVLYKDINGKEQYAYNIPVQVSSNKEWFPDVGSCVTLNDLNTTTPVVTGGADMSWEENGKPERYEYGDLAYGSLFTVGGRYG